jgi:hypothetical protein
MPVYLQIFLLIIGIVIFYFLLLLGAGWGIRRLCLKIISEMEEAKAFSAQKAISLPETRANFFKVGTRNLRPKALNVLMADKLVLKAPNGKYYLNKDKLAVVQKKINS